MIQPPFNDELEMKGQSVNQRTRSLISILLALAIITRMVFSRSINVHLCMCFHKSIYSTHSYCLCAHDIPLPNVKKGK